MAKTKEKTALYGSEVLSRAMADSLTDWFAQNRRDLPWRTDRTSYGIWVSEIMLQQTTISAVIGYYDRFMKRLPDMKALAECPEDELMKLWEGLGYYSRVRNLQKTAKLLTEAGETTLPADHKSLLALPGIGPYTAGAIASMAFDLPYPAVDGNVLRVLARLSGLQEDITKAEVRKQTEKELTSFLAENKNVRPSLFNEGIMELGEVICLPHGRPLCKDCPLSDRCLACRKGMTEDLPVRSARPERKLEKRTVFLLTCGVRTAIRKRPKGGLLSGLYEFPNVPGHLTEEEAMTCLGDMGFEARTIKKGPESRHLFTHIEWQLISYEVTLDNCKESDSDYIFADTEELEHTYALPGAFEKYRKHLLQGRA